MIQAEIRFYTKPFSHQGNHICRKPMLEAFRSVLYGRVVQPGTQPRGNRGTASTSKIFKSMFSYYVQKVTIIFLPPPKILACCGLVCIAQVDRFNLWITVMNAWNHFHLYCKKLISCGYVICERRQLWSRYARLPWKPAVQPYPWIACESTSSIWLCCLKDDWRWNCARLINSILIHSRFLVSIPLFISRRNDKGQQCFSNFSYLCMKP